MTSISTLHTIFPVSCFGNVPNWSLDCSYLTCQFERSKQRQRGFVAGLVRYDQIQRETRRGRKVHSATGLFHFFCRRRNTLIGRRQISSLSTSVKQYPRRSVC